MTSIVVNYSPFDITQKVYAYKDGNLVEEVSATIDTVPATVRALKIKFSATEVNLIGNQDYLSKFKAQIGTQFDNNDVKINIIGR